MLEVIIDGRRYVEAEPSPFPMGPYNSPMIGHEPVVVREVTPASGELLDRLAEALRDVQWGDSGRCPQCACSRASLGRHAGGCIIGEVIASYDAAKRGRP